MKRLLCIALGALFALSSVCHAIDFDLGGLVQAQYVDERQERATFAVGAARLVAMARVTDRVSVQAELELADEPNLLEAMIEYSFSRTVNIRAGQFRLPFGFETQISNFDLEAINRSLVLTHLWDNCVSRPYLRDVGALIMGRYKLFEYKVGVVNGAGYDFAWDHADCCRGGILPGWGRDNNDTKDIVGRIGAGIPMFAGLGFSFYEGEWPVDYSSCACGDDRSAKAFDLFLDTGKIILQYERVWAKGHLGRVAGDSCCDCAGDDDGDGVCETLWIPNKYGGYYVVVGYRLTPLIEPVFKADICDPDKDADGDRLTDLYFGLNLNFERKARFQVFYKESKVAKRFADSGFVAQMSAKF